MIGGQGDYDCIKAFSETDFIEDLQEVTVPTLIMRGEDEDLTCLSSAAWFCGHPFPGSLAIPDVDLNQPFFRYITPTRS